MPQENVEAVRTPLDVRAVPRRGVGERLALRFPGAVALSGRAAARLPLRSRPRQAALRWAAQVFLGAYNRKDFEAAYSLYHRDSETIVPHQLVDVGFEPVAHGRQANIDLQRRWHEHWGEFRIEPEQVIDLDGRILFLGRITGSGLSSGAGFETDWGLLVTYAAGRVIREQFFFDRDEALEAGGLPE